jgi:GTP-binding protein
VLTTYLQRRNSLRGLVLIMDARRPLTPLDRQMLDWFAPTEKPVLILLSKSDKLSRQNRTSSSRMYVVLNNSYGNCSARLFSSVTGLGVDQARHFVSRLLAPRTPRKSRPQIPRLRRKIARASYLPSIEKEKARLKGVTGA